MNFVFGILGSERDSVWFIIYWSRLVVFVKGSFFLFVF